MKYDVCHNAVIRNAACQIPYQKPREPEARIQSPPASLAQSAHDQRRWQRHHAEGGQELHVNPVYLSRLPDRTELANQPTSRDSDGS